MPDQKRPYPELVSIKPSYTLNTDSAFEDKYDVGYSSPESSASPQSLLTKPWPARPQKLHKGLEGWRWWDCTVDLVMIILPIPFIILIAAIIAVNGRKVNDYQLSILDHSIKGVSLCCSATTTCANKLRRQQYFQSYLLPPQAGRL